MIFKQDLNESSFSVKRIPFAVLSENTLQRADPSIHHIRKESKQSYPIPKGDSAYSKAKKAEYIEKNLKSAEKYYKIAITSGDRAESAIKDLAGVMHQQGKTIEAIEFLKQHRHLFTQDPSKYENLLTNLRRQIIQKGNRLNKYLKISNLPLATEKSFIISLFHKPERILAVEITEENFSKYAIVKFSSHSAARKTLESFNKFDKYKVEWFSVSGDVAGDVLTTKFECKKEKNVFCYKLFCPLSLTLTEENTPQTCLISDFEGEKLLGSSLFNYLK